MHKVSRVLAGSSKGPQSKDSFLNYCMKEETNVTIFCPKHHKMLELHETKLLR